MSINLTIIEKYLRENKILPTVWCPGCGIGLVLKAVLGAIDELNLNKNDIAMVSGIGCAGRMPVYVDFDTLHTTHGRALSFATGIKLAKPKMNVIVIMGDGDAVAIGGNHFIHTSRRNIELTAIVINNFIYGLTGGQFSPATPLDSLATTSPYGNIDQPFDICRLGEMAGASFVARSTVYHLKELQKFIKLALQKEGFSIVEALSNCHINYGKRNNLSKPIDMFNWFKNNTTLKDEEGKIKRGIFADKNIPGYYKQYQELIKRAKLCQR
ncbi:MAG: 2-oxoacid:ferredoxin oxidoreductase subunit beta [Armatimonadetes bacterium]|nr:2-oxoacid:ferredoxin oxidoreductase subunit beta [Armatimonadota bacterium]